MKNYSDELERFAEIVDKYFHDDYLEALTPGKSFVDQIRSGEIYPIKWFLSELDQSQLNQDELEFVDYLGQMNF